MKKQQNALTELKQAFEKFHSHVMNQMVEKVFEELIELELQGFVEGSTEWDSKWEELDFLVCNARFDGIPTRIYTRDGGYAKEVIVLFELDEV